MTNTATDSLTNTNFKVLSLFQGSPQNYTLIATEGVVNSPASGYVFYVDADVTTSILTFNGNNNDINTLTFNVPVVFTTKPLNGTGIGNNKNITIKGNVVFNKGVVFETNGKFNSISGDLSVFNFGDGTDLFNMTCKYLDASISTNLVPLNINGFGKINFNANAIINAYVQPFTAACIDQSPFSANIIQNVGNTLNIYLDDQMVGTNSIDMGEYVIYPAASPLTYSLNVTGNIEAELIRFPQSYQLNVTATDATITDMIFTETVQIKVDTGAKLTLENCSLSGADPLINLTGEGTLEFGPGNEITPLNATAIMFNNIHSVDAVTTTTTIISSSDSNVNLPANYTFPDPVENYEGFTFFIASNGTYNFGTFNNKTLYVYATATSTSTITVTANYGVYLNVANGSTVNINNSNIFGVDTYNNNYALRKENTGTMAFTGANKLFLNDQTYFLTDTNLAASTTYNDIGEANVEFYILNNEEGTSSYIFNDNNYNLNDLYYLATRGVYIGTDGGSYNITSEFLIQNNEGTLSIGTLGLKLLDKTDGPYLCESCTITGHVGKTEADSSSSGRIYFNTRDTCTITLINFDFYDNDYSVSPLLMSGIASITFSTGVVFHMNSLETTYIYNSAGNTITNKSNAFIIISAVNGAKTYDLDIGVLDTTSEVPFSYSNNGWYDIPIKFITDNIYNLTNINADGLIIYETNSPELILTTLNPITIYNVANDSITINSTSVLSNINTYTNAPLILQTNDINMSINISGVRLNVYGFGSLAKTGTGVVSLTRDSGLLHYYNNDYNLTASGLVSDLEYNETIYIHFNDYSFFNATSRLTFQTAANDDRIVVFTNATIISNGLTLIHNTDDDVRFNGITYTMSDDNGGLIIEGTGLVVKMNNCVINSTVGVTDEVIKINGSLRVDIANVDGGELIHNGSGNFITVNNDARLNIGTATIQNNNGKILYSASTDNITCNQVIFNNSTNYPIITHLNNGTVSIDECEFNQNTERTGAIIEFGNTDTTISAILNVVITTFPVTTATVITGNYYFFIQAYTTGTINTGNTIMNATHTNIYWPTLAQIYVDAEGADRTPYTCDNGKGYVAYSYDPSITVGFTHTNTGMYLGENAITNYYLYTAVGDDNTDTITSITATLSCTQFIDLNGDTITTNVNDVFTPAIFQAGYIGSVNESNTQTLVISDTKRLERIDFAFTDSSAVYIGSSNIKIEFDSTIIDFNYTITEAESAPTFSLDEATLSVVDTIDNSQTLTIESSKGYILPMYIIPDNNNIIELFTFRNNADPNTYVDYATYSGYVNTVNKGLLQYIPAGNTTFNFQIKYIGNGIYYEPAILADKASLSLSVYPDNIDQSNSIASLSVDVNNDTNNYTFPLSYVSALTTPSSTTVLYDIDNNLNTATLFRPDGDYNNFKIRYTFTLKFLMPLVTFDDSNHNILISGIDFYETNQISYTFTNLTDSNGDPVSGGTLTDNTNNTCNVSYSGTDLTEKRISVQVDISNLSSTQNGIIYYKKANHRIQFTLTDTVSLKGFDSTNNIIEITSGTQTADSYYAFPGTILTQAAENGVTYSNDNNTTVPPTFPQINVVKGETVRLSLLIGGQITADTPGVGENGLNIPLFLATSKNLDTNIMPTSISAEDSITINVNQYQGYKDITFTDDNKISGNNSKYTITFDQTNYPTVDKVEYIDTSRPHIITHKFSESISMTYTSDNNQQSPALFTASATPTENPSSYNIGFPIGVQTDFIPYNTTTGDSSSFIVEYVLVGTKSSGTNTVSDTLVNGTHYQISDVRPVIGENIIITNSNHTDNNYLYFTLLSQEYYFIDIYVYYADTTGTDMVNVPANSTENKIKIARYDFSNAFATGTDTLQINMGSWTIRPNSNGDLVFIYNGTLDNDTNEAVGSTFTLPVPTSLVNKIISTQ